MDKGRPIEINLTAGKKVYFASDQHLGAPDDVSSRKREKIFVKFLEQIKHDVQVLFLLGDLFDFWHEYKTVVPKGFVRILGKLAELSDSGVKIYFFTGNHDLWMRDYLQKELAITVFNEEQTFIINNKSFFIAHGDGLGPGDRGYKRMKKLFTNPVARWFFRWLHPDVGVALGTYLSRKNKLISGEEDIKFLGEDNEWLIVFSKEKLNERHYDYFIYGHRHLPMDLLIGEDKNSHYVNLGDWISYYTYAVFDGDHLHLQTFTETV
ncbi:UDP-2,3-diacylglucosamine diphosphatase [Apibacter sp. B2912]|uniref:UDP-2,3-diacylglucosamine diphosphatase n=1 Tax=Apibacter sp. B2912 TaxID=2656763 RepID=UPI00136C73A2|nr:UDP-2,3-diacylglucosamine diphosphatase [Apibacter sp. B2912]MXO32784.1 UDP-2,3-diacylglucosamine diphosphatase [Apibacter sp. B2912]